MLLPVHRVQLQAALCNHEEETKKAIAAAIPEEVCPDLKQGGNMSMASHAEMP